MDKTVTVFMCVLKRGERRSIQSDYFRAAPASDVQGIQHALIGFFI